MHSIKLMLFGCDMHMADKLCDAVVQVRKTCVSVPAQACDNHCPDTPPQNFGSSGGALWLKSLLFSTQEVVAVLS